VCAWCNRVWWRRGTDFADFVRETGESIATVCLLFMCTYALMPGRVDGWMEMDGWKEGCMRMHEDGGPAHSRTDISGQKHTVYLIIYTIIAWWLIINIIIITPKDARLAHTRRS
jgi:hypothetical protein